MVSSNIHIFKIGINSFQVYSAKLDAKTVAVKLLKGDTSGAAQQVIQEVKALSAINSPYVL